jgi:hypothetical protein
VGLFEVFFCVQHQTHWAIDLNKKKLYYNENVTANISINIFNECD